MFFRIKDDEGRKRCVCTSTCMFLLWTKLKFTNINSFRRKIVFYHNCVNVKPESFFGCLYNFFRCGITKCELVGWVKEWVNVFMYEFKSNYMIYFWLLRFATVTILRDWDEWHKVLAITVFSRKFFFYFFRTLCYIVFTRFRIQDEHKTKSTPKKMQTNIFSLTQTNIYNISSSRASSIALITPWYWF